MSGRKAPAEAPLWLISLLGVCLTTFGVYIQATGSGAFVLLAAGSLSAVGGGVLGAAISIYFASGDGRDALRSVREVLAGSLRARMRSPEEDLKDIRKPWHFYHVTEVDGVFVWRYTHYRFDQSTATGSITSRTADINNGVEHIYNTEVAVRSPRMILVDEAEGGTEPPLIAIMPYFTENFRHVRAGIFFIKSWDGGDLLTKCLWSLTPLVPAVGADVAADSFTVLEKLWDQGFRTTHTILPSTVANTGASPSGTPTPHQSQGIAPLAP
jgi:hypothetical protein